MRPLPFLGGAEDVILDVCMSSPMYLVGMRVSIRVTGRNVETWNLRLQELVTALELLVFALDCFYTVDDCLQAGLKHLCLFDEVAPCVFAELVDLLAIPPWRHSTDVVVFEVGVDDGGGRVARDNHGAAALPAAQFGPREARA